MKDMTRTTEQIRAAVQIPRSPADLLRAAGRWKVRCHDKDGNLVWTRHIKNLVTTQGLNALLDTLFDASGYTASWFAGLVSDSGFSAYAAGDTLASHAGWTEFTSYTGNRKAIAWGAAAAGVIASSSIGTFTASGTGTIKGLFVTSAETGTSGTLFAEGNFDEGDAPVASGYVITCSYELTIANAA